MTKLNPVLFSTEMVQAILEGRKTMTRRVIEPQPKNMNTPCVFKGLQNLPISESSKSNSEFDSSEHDLIFWVRETFSPGHIENGANTGWQYKADNKGQNIKWKPSIFMPKEAARIFLKVKNIRVERLMDISEEDAIAEGVLKDISFGFNCYPCNKKGHVGSPNCEDGFFKQAKDSFFSLWESINGKKSLEENPYVWVIEFERIAKPEMY